MKQPTRPELSGSFGMVSATHWLAASSAMAMLERGGNAFDAAVCGGLVLQVVEPHLNGPGGEVPILAYRHAQREVSVINGQGPLPAGATITGVRDLGLTQVPGTGLLPACVPGAFGAWMLLLEDYGRLPLEDVMAPAIGYAMKGFRLLPRAATTIRANEELFRNSWTSSGEVYLDNGTAPSGGKIWRNQTLGRTYERILREAKSVGRSRERQIEKARFAYYSGFVAEAIDEFVASASVIDDSGEAHGGFLDGSDLANWTAGIEKPLHLDYKGVRVFKTGPWGQGPVFLQQLKILEGFDLSTIDPYSAEFVHLVIESAKLALADRDSYYGDPLHVDVPMEELLSETYNQKRRKMISNEASHEFRPGSPSGYEPWRPNLEYVGVNSNTPASGAPPDPIGRDTCHLDVVDSEGNMVAATPSGGWLHGGPCVPGLGFSLSTRGQMFWLDDRSPSAFIGGRRPRTTLSPTFVLDQSENAVAFGTPGGDQQDQWSFNFFLRRLHFDMDIQSAIDAPTFHTSHLFSSFYPRIVQLGRIHVESRFGRDVINRLRELGHDVVEAEPWSLGRVCAVGKAGLELVAGSDPRQDQAYSVGR